MFERFHYHNANARRDPGNLGTALPKQYGSAGASLHRMNPDGDQDFHHHNAGAHRNGATLLNTIWSGNFSYSTEAKVPDEIQAIFYEYHLRSVGMCKLNENFVRSG